MDHQSDLYETDFARWAEDQARALRDAQRSGANLPLDWENLAEEIGSLARKDRSALRSHYRTIIEHLLKLQFSPATAPRSGWRDTVRRCRNEVEYILDDSPSLRGESPDLMEDARRRGLRDAVDSLTERGEDEAAAGAATHAGRYPADQVVGRWFPSDPLT